MCGYKIRLNKGIVRFHILYTIFCNIYTNESPWCRIVADVTMSLTLLSTFPTESVEYLPF